MGFGLDIEKLDENVEICFGGPDVNASDENLKELVTTLVDAFYKRSELMKPVDKTETINKNMNSLRKFLKDPNTVLAKDGNRIVGVAAVEELLEDYNGEPFNYGRPVLHLTSAAVLPDYQGKGIYSCMFDKRMENINKSFSSPIITCQSKDSFVKEKLSKFLVPIKADNYASFMGYSYPEPLRENLVKGGWEFFISDQKISDKELPEEYKVAVIRSETQSKSMHGKG